MQAYQIPNIPPHYGDNVKVNKSAAGMQHTPPQDICNAKKILKLSIGNSEHGRLK